MGIGGVNVSAAIRAMSAFVIFASIAVAIPEPLSLSAHAARCYARQMPKLTDHEVYDLLFAALEALGREEGVTTRGDTALGAARRMLTLLQLGLVQAMDQASDRIEGLTDPARLPPAPPG